jgi:hypothetical protein
VSVLTKQTEGGAAILRMREIAMSIYESTPGMQDEIPKHTSKILQGVRDKKGQQNKGNTGEIPKEYKFEDC